MLKLLEKVKFNRKIWFKLSFAISFRSLSIEFELFNYICSRFNWFCHYNWFGFQEFWLKIRLKYDMHKKISKFVSGSIQLPKLSLNIFCRVLAIFVTKMIPYCLKGLLFKLGSLEQNSKLIVWPVNNSQFF